jgi:hypothetical protein
MGQSALLKFLQIINVPVARSPHDTGRHELTTRFEPGCMLGDGPNHETNDYGGNDSHSGDVFEPELLDARISDI